MSRISGADPSDAGFFAGIFLRIVYWLTKRKVGKVIAPIRVTGRSPRLLYGMGMMEQSMAAVSRVDRSLKNLVSVRAATVIGCPF